MALTVKQSKFIDEYLVDLNATQAALRAGYSEKTADRIGHENLKKLEIAQELKKRLDEQQKRTQITADRVLQEYARIAFLDPRKFFNEDGSPKPITELDEDTAAALAGFDVMEIYEGTGDTKRFVGYLKKFKPVDKKGALDSLARHLGLFIDKKEITGKDGGPIVFQTWADMVLGDDDEESEGKDQAATN